jgi:hypothetical protein
LTRAAQRGWRTDASRHTSYAAGTLTTRNPMKRHAPRRISFPSSTHSSRRASHRISAASSPPILRRASRASAT